MALLVGITDKLYPRGLLKLKWADDQRTAELTTRVPMVTSYLENSGTKFVRYLRVSTQKQGIDGNGMAPGT